MQRLGCACRCGWTVAEFSPGLESILWSNTRPYGTNPVDSHATYRSGVLYLSGTQDGTNNKCLRALDVSGATPVLLWESDDGNNAFVPHLGHVHSADGSIWALGNGGVKVATWNATTGVIKSIGNTATVFGGGSWLDSSLCGGPSANAHILNYTTGSVGAIVTITPTIRQIDAALATTATLAVPYVSATDIPTMQDAGGSAVLIGHCRDHGSGAHAFSHSYVLRAASDLSGYSAWEGVIAFGTLLHHYGQIVPGGTKAACANMARIVDGTTESWTTSTAGKLMVGVGSDETLYMHTVSGLALSKITSSGVAWTAGTVSNLREIVAGNATHAAVLGTTDATASALTALNAATGARLWGYELRTGGSGSTGLTSMAFDHTTSRLFGSGRAPRSGSFID